MKQKDLVIKKTINEAANTAGKDTLPYERFISAGPDSLTDAELLAIIIRTGSGELTPVQMGEALLRLGEKYSPGLSGLHHLTLDEIMSVPGIGMVKGVKLKCVAELSRRISTGNLGNKIFFRRPKDIAAYYMERLCHMEEEHVILGYMNHQMMLTGDEEISVGSVKGASISPREIYIRAVQRRAVNIVLLHNHPGGIPEPSISDLELTRQIHAAGEIMDIRLCDHVIIGDHCYYSFMENQLLDR